MKIFHIPYGKKQLALNLPEASVQSVLTPALPPPADDPAAEVARALASPVGSPSLCELARGKRTCVVISSDHTRPVPSRLIMPLILQELRKGAPDIAVTILIATGFHRKTSREELIGKFGEEIVRNEHIVIHDCSDGDRLEHAGTLPSGGALILNKQAVQAELLVAEGFIGPHFFAGFSGGRKSVLPGIASRETIMANHCAEFIASPFARTGNLENNPVHRDMVYAAKQAKLAFIVNVVINGEKKIVKAFAGDFIKAHEAGCQFLRGCCEVRSGWTDIVVTGNGGYPLDQNVYQSVKGMTAGSSFLRQAAATERAGRHFSKRFPKQSPSRNFWRTFRPCRKTGRSPTSGRFRFLPGF